MSIHEKGPHDPAIICGTPKDVNDRRENQRMTHQDLNLLNVFDHISAHTFLAKMGMIDDDGVGLKD